MKHIDDALMKRALGLKDTILQLQGKVANDIPNYNDQAKQLYDELLGEDAAKLNVAIEEFNELMQDVHAEQESFFEAQTYEWQSSSDGKAYEKWMGSFDEISEFDLADFEEIEEPCLLEEDDFVGFVAAPGVASWPNESEKERLAREERAKQAHARNLDRWRLAVMQGQTMLGFDQWVSQPGADIGDDDTEMSRGG